MTMLFPKPGKPRRGDRACREHMSLVAQLNCIGCGRSDVQLHHPIMGRFSQTKTSDMEVLPTCPACHDLIHNHRDVWLKNHKADWEYLEQTQKAVERLRKLMVGELP